ncbi:hypothetical protein N836_14050 [Leptolyngbya sp. Heron Island J]|uniref:hypothetical protein n=1 Tax=Leptolyngbya sp. Heron Island J TaxID=1385935 RepID=UPI0003B93BCE|nr:hypothetical protein [Leptolyngbya sp. Heron Island J]ESA34879.1 hypothetical protein N836_14050 [Leptolyngbya sp. Heron Island J]
MAIFPIVTFCLLFVAITWQLLGNSRRSSEHELDAISSSAEDKTSITLDIDSLTSLLKVMAQFDSEQK